MKRTRASKKEIRYNFSSSNEDESDNENNDSLFVLIDDDKSDCSFEEMKLKKRKMMKNKTKSKIKEVTKNTNKNTSTKNAKNSKKRKFSNDCENKSNLENIAFQDDVSKKKKTKIKEEKSPLEFKIKVKEEKSKFNQLYKGSFDVNVKSKFNLKFKSENCPVNENKKFIKSENYIKKEIKTESDDICLERIKHEQERYFGHEQKEIKNEIKYEVKIKNETSEEMEDVKNSNILMQNRDEFSNRSSENKKYKLGDFEWKSNLLAEKSNIDIFVARNISYLFDNDCTIPFIARYRRDKTDNMDADTLRKIKNTYEDIKILETKVVNALKQIKKLGKLSPQLEKNLNGVHSLDELEFIYAPFKQGSSKSKAEKARALGLEKAACLILTGSKQIVIEDYINNTKDGLKKYDDVVQNIQNIVADFFSKDEGVLEYLRKIEKQLSIIIKSTKINKSNSTKGKNESKLKKNNSNEDTLGKFELYYNFQSTTKNIQPHQVLALNRGENLKILSVKMIVPEWLSKMLYKFCENKWLRFGCSYPLRTQMFISSFQDSYNRLIVPFVTRRFRSELNREAHYVAIENFALNLKNLLQTPPIKGCSILGIDPGIRYGFKFALISSNGDLLWTHVFHFSITELYSKENETFMTIIKKNLITYNCDIIAIGNGTGCRPIENIMSYFIKNDFFKPELNMKYTIVNERGASVYSCTNLAKEEFPNLDTNLISAVFIARSLQDPLNEYVKVEPKHLGVGMYQHDLSEKQLNNALDEVVGECASFTGVDINTASVHLLKRISGLNITRAANIITWRRQNGSFKNREQLKLVKGIGPKTFEQCSGFIRIHPQTALLKNSTETVNKSKKQEKDTNFNINSLDRTWIHPESYSIVYSFVDKCGINVQELGSENFINKLKDIISSKDNLKKIATDLNINEFLISFIADALMKPNDYDYRSQFTKPLFKQGLSEISNLKIGMILTGAVGNVTNFGAFVDIGVGKNGLIHISQMNGFSVQIGDRVEVRITSIEPKRGRIGLYLMQLLK